MAKSFWLLLSLISCRSTDDAVKSPAAFIRRLLTTQSFGMNMGVSRFHFL
jgi:hypothetical protein